MGLKKNRNVESKDYGEEWRELGGKRASRKQKQEINDGNSVGISKGI